MGARGFLFSDARSLSFVDASSLGPLRALPAKVVSDAWRREDSTPVFLTGTRPMLRGSALPVGTIRCRRPWSSSRVLSVTV